MSDRIGGVRAALADLDLTVPANAFAYGLAMGQAIEGELADVVDDLVHRRGVEAARKVIDKADQRARADIPGPRSGDYVGAYSR